jgi:membrane protease YdiL (CAAX protease family)
LGNVPFALPERHSLVRTVVLHLAPGAFLTLAFLLAAPAVNRAGGSSYLALLLCIPLVLVPSEVGVLLFERRRTGSSWKSIITPLASPRVSALEILLSVAALYAVSEAAGLLTVSSRSAILDALARRLPPWAVVDAFPEGVSAGTLWLGLLLSGLVAPIVEEFYFRGFLMPRIPVAGAWAPAVSAALFSIYHFFSPWNYLGIFVIFLPLAYYVRIRGKLLPAIITHSLFNSVGIVIALLGLETPF